jgi:hypothetical protein
MPHTVSKKVSCIKAKGFRRKLMNKENELDREELSEENELDRE